MVADIGHCAAEIFRVRRMGDEATASRRAISWISPSRRILATLSEGNPDCLVPKNSPGPRSFRSISEM